MTTTSVSTSTDNKNISHDSDLNPQQRVPQRSLNWLQRISRQSFLAWLGKLEGGTVRCTEIQCRSQVSESDCSDLEADWSIDDPRFFSYLGTGGSVGVAESYLQGHWNTSDLTTLLRILYRNLSQISTGKFLLADLAARFSRLRFRLNGNTRRGSRRHIAAHYDLSNDFFELFLDPTMMYSAGWFDTPHTTLHEASIAKLERICRKLNLQSTDHVMEIGTGWGGFSLHAAQHFGCHLTTTTISDAQLSMAQDRINRAGLNDRVELLNRDYRDLEGQYDKVVSIPVAAVTETEEGCFCWVKRGEAFARKPILLGDGNEIFVIVERGLAPGEEVALSPQTVMEQMDGAMLSDATASLDVPARDSKEPQTPVQDLEGKNE